MAAEAEAARQAAVEELKKQMAVEQERLEAMEQQAAEISALQKAAAHPKLLPSKQDWKPRE